MPTITELLEAMRGASRYPTKEAIINEEHLHKPEVIKAVKQWKRETWREVKNAEPERRFEALSMLCHKLAEIYRKPLQAVMFHPASPSCSYTATTRTINLNHSLSIISTLHEFAHHAFGPDETKACRWSVWLFKKTFPKAYEQLDWQGHTLVKRSN